MAQRQVFLRVFRFHLGTAITLMLHTHTHTHTHSLSLSLSLILSREKTRLAKRGNLQTKPPCFDVGQHWTESTSNFSHNTLTIVCSLDSPSADCSRFGFVRVDALLSRYFLCWVQNSVDVHITACICVIHLELCFLLAVLFVCYCVLLCDLGVYLNLP